MGEYKYIYILDRKDTIGLGSGPGKSCKQTDLLNDLEHGYGKKVYWHVYKQLPQECEIRNIVCVWCVDFPVELPL